MKRNLHIYDKKNRLMRLKELEEKVMGLKIVGLRIVSFRIWHGHVKRCLARGICDGAWIWDENGHCYNRWISVEEEAMDNDTFVERFNYASVKDWTRKQKYDIS